MTNFNFLTKKQSTNVAPRRFGVTLRLSARCEICLFRQVVCKKLNRKHFLGFCFWFHICLCVGGVRGAGGGGGRVVSGKPGKTDYS